MRNRMVAVQQDDINFFLNTSQLANKIRYVSSKLILSCIEIYKGYSEKMCYGQWSNFLNCYFLYTSQIKEVRRLYRDIKIAKPQV